MHLNQKKFDHSPIQFWHLPNSPEIDLIKAAERSQIGRKRRFRARRGLSVREFAPRPKDHDVHVRIGALPPATTRGLLSLIGLGDFTQVPDVGRQRPLVGLLSVGCGRESLVETSWLCTGRT